MFTEKISSRQLFYLLFISRTTVAISFLPSLTSADALQDAWLSALLSFLLGAAIILPIVKLALKFPEKDIVKYAKSCWEQSLENCCFFFTFFFLNYRFRHRSPPLCRGDQDRFSNGDPACGHRRNNDAGYSCGRLCRVGAPWQVRRRYLSGFFSAAHRRNAFPPDAGGFSEPAAGACPRMVAGNHGLHYSHYDHGGAVSAY